MEVKRTLMRTSMRSGGATSTSSITSGSLGPHATAAAQSVMAGNGNIGKKKDSELKKKKKMMGRDYRYQERTFALDGLSLGAAAVGEAIGVHGVNFSLLLSFCLEGEEVPVLLREAAGCWQAGVCLYNCREGGAVAEDPRMV
jgi:hypothetical protein